MFKKNKKTIFEKNKKITKLSPSISIIIAIFNRKNELFELLKSLSFQTDKDFKVTIVDDGSVVDLQPTITFFKDLMDIQYFKKKNSGPGLSRNYGVEKTDSQWVIFLDSDVIVEKNYIENLKTNIQNIPCDAFGGGDKAHKTFNVMQKAISYAMTSFLTTGGIRGKKKSVSKFQPRSFNMGVKNSVFQEVGGFSHLRIGEDPDLSMTLWEKGYQTAFFENIEVYHKRRTDLKKFSKQVYQFGCARPILNQRHPKYVKISFAFPSIFLLGYFTGIFEYFFLNFSFILNLYGIYTFVIFFHALFLTKNISVASMALLTTYIQMFSYGWGFLESWIKLNILKIKPEKAFPHHFHQQND